MSTRATTTPAGTPWYGQFWPWFLIALPAVSIVVSVASLVLAVRHGDALVRDDWYTSGLAVNRDLGREREAARRGLIATVRVDREHGRFEVTLAGDDGAAALDAELMHPTDPARDRVLHLVRSATGVYGAPLAEDVRGRWYVAVTPSSGTWRLSAALTLAPDVPIRLGPAV